MSKYLFALVLILSLTFSLGSSFSFGLSTNNSNSLVVSPKIESNHTEGVTESAKPVLTISVVEDTRLYSQDNPIFVYTLSDPTVKEADIDVLPTISCSADRFSPAGDYVVTVTGGSDDVYDIQVTNSILHVKSLISTEISIEVTPNKSYVYDGLDKEVPYKIVNGFDRYGREIKLNHEVIQVSVSYLNMAREEVTPKDAGTYYCTVEITDPSVSDQVQPKTCYLDITKAPLQITAADKSKEQGHDNPPLELLFQGLVEGETKDVLDVLPQISTTVTKDTPMGSYEITLTGGTDNNYEYKLINGTFHVTGPSVAVDFTMGNKTVDYSGNPHGVAVTISPSDFTYELTYNGSSTTPTNVGTYEVVAKCTDSRAGSNIGYTERCILVIQKATIYITADNKECYYGEDIPKLTYSISGLVDSDKGLDVYPSVICNATNSSPAGLYDIELNGGSDPNYNLHLTNGKLTIKNRELVINFGNLEFDYDGETKKPEITTEPEGVAIEVTYNDGPDLPMAAGQYIIKVKSLDPNFSGSKQATMVIWSQKEEMQVQNTIIDDGTNTTRLVIENVDAFANNQLTLYDRAGHLMYQSPQEYKNDYDLKPLNEGTYFYLFSYDLNGEKVYEKKFIELIRP